MYACFFSRYIPAITTVLVFPPFFRRCSCERSGITHFELDYLRSHRDTGASAIQPYMDGSRSHGNFSLVRTTLLERRQFLWLLYPNTDEAHSNADSYARCLVRLVWRTVS